MSFLGIGIITRNRLPVLQRCVAEVARHTRTPFVLMIADDGSDDGTVAWARGQGVPVVTGPRRGCAWNKNRALLFFYQHTGCDPIVLFEDDTWPTAADWDATWIAAARRWQHVNYGYGFDPQNMPAGRGTADAPYQCAAFGGHCTVTTREALREVGYLDTRFVGYGWEHVEWTHRFRLRYATTWALPEGMLPCLDHKVRATWPASSSNEAEANRNAAVYAEIRAEPTEQIHHPPWRDETERRLLLTEIAGALHGSAEPTYGPRDAAAVAQDPSQAPFEILGCSWPRPVVHDLERWVSEPEWDAPLMPVRPHPRWTNVGGSSCWTIDWRGFFKADLKPYHPSLSGEMRGFHVVFLLRVASSGRLIFYADDGCTIRLNGRVVHCDPTAHAPVRGEFDVRVGDRLDVAQWQYVGQWL